MDKEDIKNIGQKVYKGCGCMSIGIVVSIIILCIIGSFIDDEEPEESAKVEQTAAKDSLVVSRKQLTELTVEDLKTGFDSKTNVGQ